MDIKFFPRHLLFLAILVSLPFLTHDSLQAETLGDEVIFDEHGQRLDVDIDSDGDLHLVYNRYGTVYYKRQVDGAWRGETEVPGSSSTYNSRWYPKIAVDSSGNAHICWAGPSQSEMRYIYYNSFNGSWTGRIFAIEDDDNGSVNDTNRNDITVYSNDVVHVCAQSDFAIECAQKPASAASFSDDTTLYYNPSEPKNPSVGASNTGDVYCVYAKNEFPNKALQYNVYHDGSWGSAQRPDTNGGPCCANNISVFFDADGLAHITWVIWTTSSAEYSDLLYVNETPGKGWNSVTTLISSPNYFLCYLDECPYPRVAEAADGTVLVVFADGHDTSNVRYFLKEPAGSWPGSPSQITTSSTVQNYPAMAVDGNTFHVLWEDNRNGGRIVYRTVETGSADPTETPTPTSTPTPIETPTPTYTPTITATTTTTTTPTIYCECVDTDGDGVPDAWDNCPDTPLGSFVNSSGCSSSDVPAMHNAWAVVLLICMSMALVYVHRVGREKRKQP